MKPKHTLVFALRSAGLVALVLLGCGKAPGCGEAPDGPRSVAPSAAVTTPGYVRPRLSEAALQESLFYPLDTCVVSGKKLVPHSHYEDIGGRLVRTYNEHQVAQVKADPEKYFAQIDAAYRAQQAESYPLTVCVATGEPLPEKPVELVMDVRHAYAQTLRTIQRERQTGIHYRYTLAGRLLRFKDEAALAAFKSVDANGRMPVAEEGMDRYVTAMVSKLRPDLFKTDICPVIKRTVGRPEVDPETGGYRHYLLGPTLYILCCKTCVVDMDEKFPVTVSSVATFRGIAEHRTVRAEEVSVLVMKKLPNPPE